MRLRIPSLPARPRVHARAASRLDGGAWFPHPYLRRDRPLTLPEAAVAGTSRFYAATCSTAGVVGGRAGDGFLPAATVSTRRPLGGPVFWARTEPVLDWKPPGIASLHHPARLPAKR